MNNEPRTLQEAIVYFSDPVNCREYLVARRWPKGVTCPRCGSQNVLFLEKYNRWHCREKHPAPQFTLKTGTIMEDSPIGLSKWLTAIWQIVNCKNGISSYEIHRAIGITQKSAWFIDHRIRLALQNGSLMKIGGKGGAVEVDETYIGGKARNMHKDRKERMIDGRGTPGKVAVMGLLERHPEKGKSNVRLSTVPTTSRENLQPIIRKNVEPGTEIYTDSHGAYEGMDEYFHEFVNHAETYARGKVHTNGLENFWSLLKRGLRGTYVSVEPFHLFRYLDEQAYRYNNRKLTDSERFDIAVKGIVGKRVTVDELTGKTAEQP